ncbi:hypothetical protein KJ853_03730 [Patescibacteria group bacterium]|nr:hypothetical protein [Patescibacteria group bacterium]
MGLRKREEQLIKFRCFHCGCLVTILVRGRYNIEKAYCKKKGCARKHIIYVRSPKRARRYVKYLRKIQSRIPVFHEVEIKRIFRHQDGQLFRGRALLGLVIAEKDDLLTVEACPGGARRVYRKDQIIV